MNKQEDRKYPLKPFLKCKRDVCLTAQMFSLNDYATIQLNVKLCESCVSMRLQDSALRRFSLCCERRGNCQHGDRATDEGKGPALQIPLGPFSSSCRHRCEEGCCVCVFRECRAWMQTERVILASFSISCFHLILLLWRTGKKVGSALSSDVVSWRQKNPISKRLFSFIGLKLFHWWWQWHWGGGCRCRHRSEPCDWVLGGTTEWLCDELHGPASLLPGPQVPGGPSSSTYSCVDI